MAHKAPKPKSKVHGAVGWMAAVLTQMANKRTWALAVSKATEIVITQGFPLYIMAARGADLIAQCKTAAQGSATKAISPTLAPNPLADITINLGNVKSYGVRVKIADSLTGFKFGTYNVQLLDGATVLGDVFVRAASNVADFVMLGISNAGGQASIISIANPQVKIINANSSLVIGNSITAETLNERDLGLAIGANSCDEDA